MALTDLQKRMLGDMLIDYWYNAVKHNPSLEKEFSQLNDILQKLKEEK